MTTDTNTLDLELTALEADHDKLRLPLIAKYKAQRDALEAEYHANYAALVADYSAKAAAIYALHE